MGRSAKDKRIDVYSYSSIIGAKTKKGTKGDDLINPLGFSITQNSSTYYMHGRHGRDSLLIPASSQSLRSFKSFGKKAQFEIEYMNFEATSVEYLAFDDITLQVTSKGLVSSSWRPKGLSIKTEPEDSTLSGERGTWEKTANQYGVDVITFLASDGSRFLADGNNFVFDQNQDLSNSSSEPIIGKVWSALFSPSFVSHNELTSDVGSWVIMQDSAKGYITWSDGTIAAWLDVTGY